MQAKILLMIAVGLLAIIASGAGTFYLIRTSEDKVALVEARLARLGDQISVVVPARAEPAGAPLPADAFTTLNVPRSMLPEGMLHALPQLPKTPGASYVALTPLKKGQLLLPSDIGLLGGPADTGPMATANPDAIAIRPANLATMRRLLGPGALVDIFWQRGIGGGAVETRLLAEGLRVVALPGPSTLAAAGSSARQGAAQPAGRGPALLPAPLIVESSSRAVARLLQAATVGKLYVARAAPHGRTTTGEIVIGNAELADLPLVVAGSPAKGGTPVAAAAPLPAPALTGTGPKLCTLTVVRSNVTTELKVPCK